MQSTSSASPEPAVQSLQPESPGSAERLAGPVDFPQQLQPACPTFVGYLVHRIGIFRR
jgi:hypothetical protein